MNTKKELETKVEGMLDVIVLLLECSREGDEKDLALEYLRSHTTKKEIARARFRLGLDLEIEDRETILDALY